jgi:hypothetical protein
MIPAFWEPETGELRVWGQSNTRPCVKTTTTKRKINTFYYNVKGMLKMSNHVFNFMSQSDSSQIHWREDLVHITKFFSFFNFYFIRMC